MQKTRNKDMMQIGELLDCKLVDADGRTIGHVADIQLTEGPEYRICAFLYGEQGWMHRFHLLNPFEKRHTTPTRPKEVPWEAVERIEPGIITLKSNKNV